MWTPPGSLQTPDSRDTLAETGGETGERSCAGILLGAAPITSLESQWQAQVCSDSATSQPACHLLNILKGNYTLILASIENL